ncbi:MAG: LiaF transmembrane domain-containing protein [Patescibacteria group bacterium]|jgi:predicted membrane protein
MSIRVLFGLLFIIFGLLFFIDQLGITQLLGFPISVYWPFILILFGLALLLYGRVKGGLFIAGIGAALQASQLYDVSFWNVLWPFLLIWMGISILFKHPRQRKFTTPSKDVIKADDLDENIEFSEVTVVVDSKDFRGGRIRLAFGQVKVDLTQAKLSKSGAELAIDASFGGVNVFVPKTWKVRSTGTAVLGSWKNETGTGGKSPVLTVSGSVNFGEVTISN